MRSSLGTRTSLDSHSLAYMDVNERLTCIHLAIPLPFFLHQKAIQNRPDNGFCREMSARIVKSFSLLRLDMSLKSAPESLPLLSPRKNNRFVVHLEGKCAPLAY